MEKEATTMNPRLVKNEQLLGKIDQLKTRFADPAYPDDYNEIAEWEGQVKRAMIQDSLRDHEAVKLIISQINKEIDEIDFVLLNKDGLEKTERDIILMRKKMYTWFLDMISPPVEQLQEIEKNVDEALKGTEAIPA